jgi:hypothetical protein
MGYIMAMRSRYPLISLLAFDRFIITGSLQQEDFSKKKKKLSL